MKELSLQAIKPSEIKDNPIEMFHNDWAVIAAGDPDDFNEMTVSWGALGASWGNQKPIAIIFVSPTRYTHQYLESHDTFSINVFPQEFKKIEAYVGSHSGRDGDKVAATGLEVAFTENGTPVFPQSRLIIECKQIYSHDLGFSLDLRLRLPGLLLLILCVVILIVLRSKFSCYLAV